MKKMICAAVFGLLFVNVAHGFFGRGCNTGCAVGYSTGYGVGYAGSSAFGYADSSAAYEQAPPICTRSIQVPRTVMETKVVTVPAIRQVIPQPALCRRIPQPARCIRIPQPPIVTPQADLIKYEAVPDRVEQVPQAPIIRYMCPAGTSEGYANACPAACPAVETACAPCA